MGTFQYMAPEQLEGAEADPRSDIFSFGAVLYETITGRRAFQGKSHASLISAILTADPAPVSTLQPLTPPSLERTIGRCLAKDPEDRWQTARDLANELSWIAGSGSQAGAPAVAARGRVERERLAWSVAAALAALLVAALFFTVRHLTEAAPAPPVVRFSIEKPEGGELGSEAVPVLSHDGRRIAFSAIAGGRPRIFIRPLNAATAQALPGTEDGQFPFFSPDDRVLGFITPGRLKRLDLSAGGVQTICDLPDPGPAAAPGAWGPDGTILLAYANGATVGAVAASGGTPRVVTERSGNERGHAWPGFLPDGRHFLYSALDEQLTRYSVYAGSMDDPRFKKHLLDATGVAEYAPPGYLLFVRDDTLMAQPFDARKLELTGIAMPVAEQAGGGAALHTGAGARFSASAAGTLVWKPGPNARMAQLTWFDRSGKLLGTLGEPGETANPVLSPDGQRVLATIRDPATVRRDIWVYDLVKGGIRRLTFGPADNFNPVWSPDGRYIAFSSNRKGQKDIYRKLSDGTGAEEELLASDVAKNVESWSADGKYIVYNQTPANGVSALYLLPVNGDRRPVPFDPSKHTEIEGSLSPNGRWIAYRSNESGGRQQIYVQAAPGTGGQGKWQVSPGTGVKAQWRSDGRELFYQSGARLFAVPVKTDGPRFEAGTPVELFDIRPGPSQRNHFTVSADGQRFLVSMALDEKGFDHFNVILNFTAGLKR
jgi:Tol biopolymer transport system component